jgi:hypothetical protein
MKSEPLPRLGVIDAISAGLNQTWRRPWLILIPAMIDFWLWLGPRISIEPLVQRSLRNTEQLLQMMFTPAQLAGTDSIWQVLREGVATAGAQMNLADGITGGWLGAPSVLSTLQFTRMTFITDLVPAPAGLARQVPHMAALPIRGIPIMIDRTSTLLLVLAAAWLIGQLLLAFYMLLAGGSRTPAGESTSWRGLKGYLRLALRLSVFSILLGLVVLVLWMPLGFAMLMWTISNSSVLGLLVLLFGGVALWLTMWFLLALFFVNEGILLDHQPLGRSLAVSVALVHRNFGAAIGLAALVNLLIYGFRIIWDVLGQWPVGTVVAILGNAYLATSLLLATFAFFESLRKAAVAERAKVAN